jgi:hypothetical protein
LIAAAAVLAIGELTAWPLRRTEPLMSGMVVPAANPPAATSLSPITANGPLKALPVSSFETTAADAQLSGTSAIPVATTLMKPATAPSTGSASGNELAESAERIHIVHEGDSLERLAKRYLDDAGRAMEIFELNRDALANPHLLPLGAELRIPTKDHLPLDRSASGALPPVK